MKTSKTKFVLTEAEKFAEDYKNSANIRFNDGNKVEID